MSESCHQKNNTQNNNTTNPKTTGPAMPSTKGIQTNSIDINTLLSSQTSAAHRALSLDSAAVAFRTLVGPIPAMQIAVISGPTPAQHDLPRLSRPALRRALSHRKGVSWRWSPRGRLPEPTGSCCPPLPGDSENIRGRGPHVQIRPLWPGSPRHLRRSEGRQPVRTGVSGGSAGVSEAAPGRPRSSSCPAAAPATRGRSGRPHRAPGRGPRPARC